MNIIYKIYKTLECAFCDQITEEQRKYRKSKLLNKYSPQDWRDDIFWR